MLDTERTYLPPRPSSTAPLVVKACRGACGRILPATAEHFYTVNGDKLRPVCRACTRVITNAHKKAVRARSIRVCDYCRVPKALREFDPYLRDGKEQLRETCRSCVEKIANPDPLTEGEADLAAGLRGRQRWAITLSILLGCRRMSLADYKALSGEALRAFEARWSGLMRELARDAGEWLPEWDSPAHMPGSRPAPRPADMRRVA